MEDPIGKALWMIETDVDGHFDLQAIADACGVSRFCLARAFVVATGWPVMRYARVRRLSRAARRLADGETDILGLALESGYGSHEAFTRAFREHFGLTPESVRARGHLDGIQLREAMRMRPTSTYPLTEPRFEQGEELLIAGLGERFTADKSLGITALWQRFVPYIGRVSGQQGYETYGLCHSPDEEGGFEYMAGVRVNRTDDLPAGFTHQRLPARRYAVFRHQGHISSIHETFAAIFQRWLPQSGLQAADAPEFEYYSADFDPMAGTGWVEIWVPIKD
ncbi:MULTISPECIES: AraC family transcriptional regulator [unclassified Pseudomonas]|uniref:AraC family transcriptional regulator n=1 Tax=unclassified Pseudomonas TaxID=196821 RepID=UPI00129EFD62|nr:MULTISPECIES: AraC family transcriptional regulator [unclassified Pseudomonas]MDH4652790.1 AraC family transcriptional regulator [Pseudomonas sp. BN606]MRK20575.1 AraC family transcriptional regulator [Pseudomonas sp. JG-B]